VILHKKENNLKPDELKVEFQPGAQKAYYTELQPTALEKGSSIRVWNIIQFIADASGTNNDGKGEVVGTVSVEKTPYFNKATQVLDIGYTIFVDGEFLISGSDMCLGAYVYTPGDIRDCL